MDLAAISKIHYKQKKMLVSESCLIYNKLLKTQNMFDAKSNELNDILRNSSIASQKTLSIFETILALLSAEQSLVIHNDFITPNKNAHWYFNHWSKTTYYKIKNQAVDQFLFLLYG